MKQESRFKNFLTRAKKNGNILNRFNMKVIFSSLFIFFTTLSTTFAATSIVGSCSRATVRSFRELIMNLVIGCVLSRVIYLIISFAVIVFLWGVFKFIRAEGDDKQSGRELIIYGIIGLFVMVSLWGLVRILQSTFNLTSTDITPRSVNIQGL